MDFDAVGSVKRTCSSSVLHSGTRCDLLSVASRRGQPVTDCVLLQQQPLRTAAVKATSRAQRSDMQTEDMVEGDGQLSTPAGNGVPLEIQWLVDLLVEQALDKVSIAIVVQLKTIV